MGSDLDESGYNLYRAMRVLTPASAFSSVTEASKLELSRLYRYAQFEIRFKTEQHKQREHEEGKKLGRK